MTITLNDRPISLPPLATLAQLLELQGITPDGKAVAVNNNAIPSPLWHETLLHDGDAIVVFRAFYGG